MRSIWPGEVYGASPSRVIKFLFLATTNMIKTSVEWNGADRKGSGNEVKYLFQIACISLF